MEFTPKVNIPQSDLILAFFIYRKTEVSLGQETYFLVHVYFFWHSMPIMIINIAPRGL